MELSLPPHLGVWSVTTPPPPPKPARTEVLSHLGSRLGTHNDSHRMGEEVGDGGREGGRMKLGGSKEPEIGDQEVNTMSG